MEDERWELSIGVLCVESGNTQIRQKFLDRKQKIKPGRNVVIRKYLKSGQSAFMAFIIIL